MWFVCPISQSLNLFISKFMTSIRLLTLISALFYVAIGISSPLITLYLQSLGADFAQISLILASVTITMFFANYGWGWLSDRLGRRKPLLVTGLLILATAFFLLSRVPNGNYAWAARIFEGVGGAAYSTVSLALMGDLLEAERQKGRSMGVFRGIGSFAFAVGAVLGGRLADATSIAQTLMVCSGLYLLAALAALAIQEVRPVLSADKLQPTPAVPIQNPQSKIKNFQPLPLFFLAGVVLWTAAHSASASMWPNYMQSLGYSKTASGALWGLAAFIEFPAMFVAGSLSDIVGRAPLLMAGGLFISLTNLGYLLLAGVFPLLLGVQVIRGFGFGSYTTTAMTFATEHSAQKNRGSKSGLFNTVSTAGSLLGSFLGGNLVQAYGFHFLYGVCSSLALGAAICFLVLRYRTKQAITANQEDLRTSGA
ncbi:MAG: MFS transporter [Caldilinea sp. CFX5]|nr:MFS transporter [Caldilinea sp. CFX5]